MLEELKFRLRWWQWLLGGPNYAKMAMRGYDKETRRILRKRHWASEPKRLHE